MAEQTSKADRVKLNRELAQIDVYKRQEVPWANDYQLSPKSVRRDMLESASDFKGYIQKLGIARSEGILLRYLAEAYRSLCLLYTSRCV